MTLYTSGGKIVKKSGGGGLLSNTGSSLVLQGMTIPAGHPRIWYSTPQLLSAARAWYGSNPFTASGALGHEYQLEVATQGLLSQNAAVCSNAVTWALSVNIAMVGTGSDEMRWYGENAILTFDWCYDYFTVGQRATFINNWNTWLAYWKDDAWGGNRFHAARGIPMYGNNYYWGYMRNEALWGIVTAGENPQAESFLIDSLQTRWTQEVIPAAATINPPYTNSMLGGVMPEGDQYGSYVVGYPTSPFYTAKLLGRDIYTESNFFNEALYNLIHATTMGTTTRGGSNTGYEIYPFNDSNFWRYGSESTLPHYINFFMTMITAFPATNMARYAQQWMNLTPTSVRPPHITSTLPTVTPLAFSNLPLDYYTPGIGFFYGRNRWQASGTQFFWMLGQHAKANGTDADTVGHRHDEIGSFQIWRNGYWLCRNDSSYSDSIVGGDPGGLIGSNTLLINGVNIRYNTGLWTVRRLESKTDYAYANTEYTTVYNGAALRVEREFVFVRALDTTVIFDRINTAGSTTKTFLAHFEANPALQDASHVNAVSGTESLRVTHLLPATPTRRVIEEGGGVGQYRLEVDTTGTQSYFLHALQAKGASDPELNPTFNDSGTYDVTLNGSISLSFTKGASSTGGSITISGVTTNFTTSVQSLTVTTSGVTWN